MTQHDGENSKAVPGASPRLELIDPEEDLSITRLANAFEASARRWELIVYPLLVAFVVLAGYGFFLVYNLTRDVASLAHNVAALTGSIDRVARDMQAVTGEMRSISETTRTMSVQMGALDPMRANMNSIDQSTRAMAASADMMRYQMGALNHNVGRPISQMSSFMPW